MKKFIHLIVLLFLYIGVHAQDPHFSQFFASPLTLNPAFTGKIDGVWRLATNHRDQWPSIPKAYVTTSASLDFPLMRKRLPEGDVFGLGISGLSDASANSALKLNYLSMALSYHKALDEDGYNTIGAGFQGTYCSSMLDFTKLTFEDELGRNGFSQGTSAEFQGINPLNSKVNYLDMNAGILFSGSTDGFNNYYAGVSMYHINKPSVSFRNNNSNSNWFLTNRFTIHGGGKIPLNDYGLDLNASIIHQIQNKSSETVVGGAVSFRAGGYDEKPNNVSIGSWLRLNDALIPYIGLEIGDLRFGASYDVNISDLKAATNSKGGSEFSLIYIKHPEEYKGIPCPKF